MTETETLFSERTIQQLDGHAAAVVVVINVVVVVEQLWTN